MTTDTRNAEHAREAVEIGRLPDGYVPIGPESAQAIQAFTARLCGPVACDATAGTLLTWCAPQGGIVRVGGDWCSAYWPKIGMLGFPLVGGGRRQEDIPVEDVLAEVARIRSVGLKLKYVIDAPAAWTEANAARITAAGFSIRSDGGMRDYVYDAADLANLPGSKYGAKRNQIHQFERDFPGWRAEPLRPDPAKCPQMRRFIEDWRRTANADSGALDGDISALGAAFANWGSGLFEGCAIYAEDGSLVAFSVYSLPTADSADIHFEKAAHGIKGAYQAINRETARILLRRGVKWINREQDMGVPGLRKAKESYCPAIRLPQCALVV